MGYQVEDSLASPSMALLCSLCYRVYIEELIDVGSSVFKQRNWFERFIRHGAGNRSSVRVCSVTKRFCVIYQSVSMEEIIMSHD
jgi:hypothetical protein